MQMCLFVYCLCLSTAQKGGVLDSSTSVSQSLRHVGAQMQALTDICRPIVSKQECKGKFVYTIVRKEKWLLLLQAWLELKLEAMELKL